MYFFADNFYIRKFDEKVKINILKTTSYFNKNQLENVI